MRRREVHPGFFLNEKLGACSPLARLMFEGLWCLADREGRLEYRPERIRAEVLPYDRVEGAPLIDGLERAGFVRRYQAGGLELLQIVAFRKYQHPHPNEVPSRLPPPPLEAASDLGAVEGAPGSGSAGRDLRDLQDPRDPRHTTARARTRGTIPLATVKDLAVAPAGADEGSATHAPAGVRGAETSSCPQAQLPQPAATAHAPAGADASTGSTATSPAGLSVEGPSVIEQLRRAVVLRLGIVGRGGVGIEIGQSRRLGEIIRDANAAVKLRGLDAVVDACVARGQDLIAIDDPPVTMAAFGWVLRALAQQDASAAPRGAREAKPSCFAPAKKLGGFTAADYLKRRPANGAS